MWNKRGYYLRKLVATWRKNLSQEPQGKPSQRMSEGCGARVIVTGTRCRNMRDAGWAEFLEPTKGSASHQLESEE
jgi:hypothetical protein